MIRYQLASASARVISEKRKSSLKHVIADFDWSLTDNQYGNVAVHKPLVVQQIERESQLLKCVKLKKYPSYDGYTRQNTLRDTWKYSTQHNLTPTQHNPGSNLNSASPDAADIDQYIII